MVRVSLNANIAGDDVVNIAEQAAGFDITGTVDTGAAVSVTIDSGIARPATVTGTTWMVTIPSGAAEITGTSVTVRATATLSGSTTGEATRTLTVDLTPPTATYAAPATLTVGTAITTITPGTPSGDISTYTVQSGTLPPGLTLDGTGGGISGTPTTANAATAPVTIGLTDTNDNPAGVSLTFPAVAMGSQTLTGFAYSADTATVGQPAPTVTEPTGQQTGSSLSYASGNANICTVDATTGALTLVAAGTCAITVTASATADYQAATATFTITVSEAPVVMVTLNANIVGNDIVNIAERAAGFDITGTVDTGAAVSVTIDSGIARPATVTDTTWVVAIPADDSEITGTSVTVTATATLAGSTTGEATRLLTVDLTPPTATYAAPATLTVGTAITTITPGTPSGDISTYTVQSGTLPPGLTLDGTGGGISGTPTTANAATAPVTIGLTDTNDNPAGVSLTFPAVAMGSQTLTGFTYSAATATLGQSAPTVTEPTGAVAASSLSYASGDTSICMVDADTGALTLVAAGSCVITVTASETPNYQAATANVTIGVFEAGVVRVSLNANIAGDDVVNIAEQAAGFEIRGTVDTGAAVSVTIDSGIARPATVTGTTWMVTIPSGAAEITGTSVTVRATATLSGSTPGEATRTLTVDLTPPTATYAAPATLTVGTAITTITPGTPSGDISTYTVQSGTLPPGLTLDGTGGGISGTPTTANAATAPVTIGLTDTNDNPAGVSLTFPAVAMGSQTLTGFTYSADTATLGQSAPTVTEPTGQQTGSSLSYASGDASICTVDATTGALTLVAAGTCAITVTASETADYQAATATFTITVSEAPVVMVTLNANIAGNDIVNIAERAAGFDITGTVDTGAAVSVTIDSGIARPATVTGTTWVVAIPADDSEITGTSVTVTATATLSGSTTGEATRTLTVDLTPPTATYAAPATLTVGTAITTITPGTPSGDISTYTVQSGTLPPGLTLDGTGGGISGTPTTANAATAPVTIGLTDTNDNPAGVSLTFPAVAMGSQTLTGFTYSAATATLGQSAPTVTEPTGAVAASSLSYASGDTSICMVDADTGALTLVAAGSCVITVTASETPNYQAATANVTIGVFEAGVVRVSLNANIAGDDVVNIAEQAAGFEIRGTVDTGAAVSVTIDSGIARPATVTGTTWMVTIPSGAAEITGTSVTVRATATLAGSTPGEATQTLTVDLTPPTATYAAPATLTVGTAIITITPGTPSGDISTYTVQSGTLPPGLTLDGTGGGISGTPTTANAATAPVTIGLTDTNDNPADVSLTFPAVAMGSQTLTGFTYSADTATVGQPAPTVTEPTGQQTGSSLSYASGNASICTVDATTGALTLVGAGTCAITVTASATANYQAATANVTIGVFEAGVVRVSLNANIAGDDVVNIAEQAAGFDITGTVDTGAAVSVTIDSGIARPATVTGTTWVVAIPADDSEITGTSVTVTATATLAGSTTGEATQTLTVDLTPPTATYAAPATLTVGTAITTITPGTPSGDISTYTVQSGTLPPGLTLDGTGGGISGTPTTANAATAPVTIGLTDTNDNPAGVSLTFPAVAMGSQTPDRLYLQCRHRHAGPVGPDRDRAHRGGSRQQLELRERRYQHLHGGCRHRRPDTGGGRVLRHYRHRLGDARLPGGDRQRHHRGI